MIQLILKGGLGNQMFQYASAYALSRTLSTELVLNTTFLDTHLPVKHFTKRNYELELFAIKNAVVAGSGNVYVNRYVAYILLSLRMYFGTIPSFVSDNKWFTLLDSVLKRGLLQPEPDLETLTKLPADIYLESYLNDYKLFDFYEQDIQTIFDTDKLFDANFATIESAIKSCDSVAINIRRGDYLNPKTSKILRTLDDAYYTTAIKLLKEKITHPHFFIFSYDYPEGMDKPFSLEEGEYTLLGPSYVGDRFKTYLRLISLCSHNIIANSTFSFWGAYLNKNRGLVLAPSRWGTSNKVFSLPEHWIKIDA